MRTVAALLLAAALIGLHARAIADATAPVASVPGTSAPAGVEPGTLAAGGSVQVSLCYNYDCRSRATVRFDAATLRELAALFAAADSPAAEREAISRAVGELYFLASLDTPIWRDRGENYNDGEVDGRMDCLDHSTNTTTLLQLFAERGWLRHHRVSERVVRGRLTWIHWSARVTEEGSGEDYVVDTWFLDPGHPATISRLGDWRFLR
jgi:hypothetical protein